MHILYFLLYSCTKQELDLIQLHVEIEAHQMWVPHPFLLIIVFEQIISSLLSL